MQKKATTINRIKGKNSENVPSAGSIIHRLRPFTIVKLQMEMQKRVKAAKYPVNIGNKTKT